MTYQNKQFCHIWDILMPCSAQSCDFRWFKRVVFCSDLCKRDSLVLRDAQSASASSLSRLPARILPHDVSGRAPFLSLNIDVNEHRAYTDIMSIIETLSFMAMPISPTTENNLFCTDWYKYYRTHIYLWNTMYEYKIQCMIMM